MRLISNMFYNHFRTIIVHLFGNFSSQMSDGDSTERHTDDETPVKQDFQFKITPKSCLVSLEWTRQLPQVESYCRPCDTWLFRQVMQLERCGVIKRQFQDRRCENHRDDIKVMQKDAKTFFFPLTWQGEMLCVFLDWASHRSHLLDVRVASGCRGLLLNWLIGPPTSPVSSPLLSSLPRPPSGPSGSTGLFC